jgi:hypothetical protein
MAKLLAAHSFFVKYLCRQELLSKDKLGTLAAHQQHKGETIQLSLFFSIDELEDHK